MPNPIVFPCPHCGASISVDGSATSTQCQFCGSSAAVPDELRPKVAPPDPAAPAMSISDLYSGMPGMSGMSQNFDVGKLKAMADAVRAGNKIEAIRLYRENFGVDLAAARQAVDLMTSGRSVGFGQMQTGTPVTFDVSGMAASTPPAMPQPLPYVMPNPPMIMTPQARGRGGATCFVLGLFLLIGVITAGGIIAGIVAGTPGLSTSFTNLFNQASNTYPRVVLTFGGKGSGVGLFTDPRTISVDAKGNIYVADYSDGRVQVFDSQGNYASQWKITDEKKPIVNGLAASRNGKVYAAVSGGLYAYDDGTGKSLGKLNYDRGFDFNDVKLRPNGGLVAPSFAGHDDVVLFNGDGQFERVITNAISTVSGDSELDMKVAVDGHDNIFILGTFNNAVFQYDAHGQYVNRFGSQGSQNGQFQGPSDIAVDGQGQVYVADAKGIQVFAPDGRYISVISMPDLAFVFGMTFDDKGALYAVGNTSKVYKILLAATSP